MKAILTFSLLLFLNTQCVFSQSWKTYPYQQAGSVLNFPRDEGWHPIETSEWWYTTAQVTGSTTGHKYDIMLTYFDHPQFTFGGFRIFNIADENTGQFFQQTSPCNYPVNSQTHQEINAAPLGGLPEDFSTLKDSLGNLIPFQYHVKAAAPTYSINFNFNSLKRPLMVGGTGYLDQGLASYTYYYSLTAIAVTGNLTVNGITENVTGTAWLDRQWGSFDPSTGEQYEWFSVQLSNGMDMNIWNVFTASNTIPDTTTYRFSSTYINDSTDTTNSDFQLKRLAYERTPDNLRCYAKQWKYTHGSIDLTISTVVPNTEVLSPFRFYEGSTTITGTVDGAPVTGIGFAELLHSYVNPIISMLHPVTADTVGDSLTLAWKLQNRDDGRDLVYDVELSTDNKNTFNSIAANISSLNYLWNTTGIADGTDCWFRITGHSLDGTLFGSVVTANAIHVNRSLGIKNWEAENNLMVYSNEEKSQVFVEFELKESSSVVVRVYDVFGKEIALLSTNDTGKNKSHRFVWNTSGIKAGIYFVRLQGKNVNLSKKISLVK